MNNPEDKELQRLIDSFGIAINLYHASHSDKSVVRVDKAKQALLDHIASNYKQVVNKSFTTKEKIAMAYQFNDEEIKHLTTNHNWELAYSGSGKYHLRQKDKHHMKTIDFELAEDVANKYLDA